MRHDNRFVLLYALSLLFSTLSAPMVQAQDLGGVVRYRNTGEQIRSAPITIGNLRTATDASGRFGKTIDLDECAYWPSVIL